MRGRLFVGAAFSGVIHVGLLLAASAWVLQVGRPAVPPPIPVSLLVLPAPSPPPAIVPEARRPAPPPVVPPKPLPEVAAPAPAPVPSPPAPVEAAPPPPPVAEAAPEPPLVPDVGPPARGEAVPPARGGGAPAAPLTGTKEAGGGSPAGTGVGASFVPPDAGPGIALAPGAGGAGPGAAGPGGVATPSPPPPVLPLSAPRPLVGASQRPAYPEPARRAGIEGTTQLKILVRADGSVGAVEVAGSAGDPSLDAAAIFAARTWRFEPARRGADRVAVWILRDVEFRLE